MSGLELATDIHYHYWLYTMLYLNPFFYLSQQRSVFANLDKIVVQVTVNSQQYH